MAWADGSSMSLLNLWLRDNCCCDECKLIATSEKKFQISSVSCDIAPVSCTTAIDDKTQEEVLLITWPDGHETSYSATHMRAFIDENGGWDTPGTLLSPPVEEKAQEWAEDFQPLRVDCEKLLRDEEEAIVALTDFLKHGVMVVTGASSVPRSLERLQPVFGPIHEVLFERVHNVVLDPSKIKGNCDQEGGGEQVYNIAHTGLAVPPHNDFASYTWNPSVQCLHMLHNDANGGMSCVVDGWATLRRMQEEEPALFAVLTRFKVPFREFDAENETYTEATIVRTDPQTGAITALRYSNQLMQAVNPLHPDTALFYRAYHYLSCGLMGTGEVDNAAMSDRRSFRLSAGEVIVVAAHRVLHARSHIQPTGYRHLQDAYFCHDNLRNKLTLLLRRQQSHKTAAATASTAVTTTSAADTKEDHLFRNLASMSKAQCDHMTAEYNKVCTAQDLAHRSLLLLQQQNTPNMKLGCRVCLYEHGLQTATRAHRAGADEETVVVALLHDIGELFSPSSHGDVAAAMLQPYISPKNQWVLRMHEVFQGYHYFEHIGANKHKRDEWKNHEFYDACVRFCDEWDQASFDEAYDSLPLEFFRPMVENVFAKTAYWWDSSHPKAVAVLGGPWKDSVPVPVQVQV